MIARAVVDRRSFVPLFRLFVVCCLCGGASTSGLNVRVKIPPAVLEGGAATLLCLYELRLHHAALEDSPHRTSSWAVGPVPLYSVRWYRGTREIYRYEPNATPPAKAFALPGLRLDMAMCNAHQVTLVDIPKHLAGSYTCEVTADAPTFSTDSASGTLRVLSDDEIHATPTTTSSSSSRSSSSSPSSSSPSSSSPSSDPRSGSNRTERVRMHDAARLVLLFAVCRVVVDL